MYFNYMSKDLQHVHRQYWRTIGNIIILGGSLGLSSVLLFKYYLYSIRHFFLLRI